MSSNTASDILYLYQLVQCVGLREISDLIQQNGGNYRNVKVSKKQPYQNSVPLYCCNSEFLRYNYAIYRMLSLHGHRTGKGESQVDDDYDRLGGNKSPFSIIFGYFFVDIFKRIKLLLVENKRKEFEKCVDGLTRLISSMVAGQLDINFYSDLGSEDHKRFVFLLRTTVLLFCDRRIDVLYPNREIPIRLIFQWARCVISIINLLKVLNPKCISGFEHDLIGDIKDILNHPVGSIVEIFHVTVKCFEVVNDGIEIKNFYVTVNSNTIRIVSILLSELLYSNSTENVYDIVPEKKDVMQKNECSITTILGNFEYPISLLADKVAFYLLSKCLWLTPTLSGPRETLIYFLSLVESFIFVKLGYCDLYTKEHFLRYMFNEPNNGDYNKNNFVEWIDRLENRGLVGVNRHFDAEYDLVLKVTQSLHEILMSMFKALDVSNSGIIELVGRLILCMYIYYYKYKILTVGIASLDLDYYTMYYRFWAVFIDRFRHCLSDELADIAISSLLMSVNVISQCPDAKRLLCVLPQLLFSGRSLTEFDIVGTYSDSIFSFNILRIDSVSYVNCKSIVLKYLRVTDRYSDTLNIIFAGCMNLNVRLHSLYDLRGDKLMELVKLYSKSKDRKFIHTDKEGYPPSFNFLESKDVSIGVCDISDEQKSAQSYEKCISMENYDEKFVCLICLGVEISLLCLKDPSKRSTKDLELCFTFLNSLVSIMLDIEVMFKDTDLKAQHERSELFTLVFETYFHVEIKNLGANSDLNIKYYISRNTSVCDAIVELLINNFVGKCFFNVKNFENPSKIQIPDKDRIPWLTLLLLLRCFIASPIKCIPQVISGLTSICKINADHLDKAKVHVSKISTCADKQAYLQHERDICMVIEKLVIQALARYLSHSVTETLLNQSGELSKALDTQQVTCLFKEIFVFMRATVFSDPVYNCIDLLPLVFNLFSLFIRIDRKGLVNFGNYFNLNEVATRKQHAIAYSIPFVSDLDNFPLHCKFEGIFLKNLSFFSLNLPRFCFYCKCNMEFENINGYYYFTWCKKCGQPCPLIPEGEINLSNIGETLFFSTRSLMFSDITEKSMLSVIKNGEIEREMDFSAFDDLFDNVFDIINNIMEKIITIVYPREYMVAFMESVSTAIAMCVIFAPVVPNKIITLMSKLTGFSKTFGILLLSKLDVSYKFINAVSSSFSTEFFKSRFSECSLLFTDGGLSHHEIKSQYFYDFYILSLCSEDKESKMLPEICFDGIRQSFVMSNMGIQSITELFMHHLRELHEVEKGIFDPENFAVGLYKLSELSNLFNVPLNKLANSGLCITLLDMLESESFRFKGKKIMISYLHSLLLNSGVKHSLNVIFDRPLRQILPSYISLFGKVEYNDYTLFRILLSMNEVPLNGKVNPDDLKKLCGFVFHSFVRLMWFATNPHIVFKLLSENIKDELLKAQCYFVIFPLSLYLKLQLEDVPLGPCKSAYPHTDKDLTITDDFYSNNNTKECIIEEKMRSETRIHDGFGYSACERDVVNDFVRENFIRVLELFVTIWLKGEVYAVSHELKNKRVFYPDIYAHGVKDADLRCQTQRVYNCIAILLNIYTGDLDIFCDRIIEALTICEVTSFNYLQLLECWTLLSKKLTLSVIGKYSPGIVYHISKIMYYFGDDRVAEIVANIENELLSKLAYVPNGSIYSSCVTCIIDSFDGKIPKDIRKNLQSYSSMIFSRVKEQKIPYITREAGALAASKTLSRTPFIFNDERFKLDAENLSMSALLTISEYSDDLARSPTTLATACCSILGYLHCDLQDFRYDRKDKIGNLSCENLEELAVVILKDYLIPNMHMQVTSYCIQEVLKFLGFYVVTGDQSIVAEAEKRWRYTFDEDIRNLLEPYRKTNFLRSKQIEAAIIRQLEGNTVLDIKCLVWWLLKMIPSDCPAFTLFRACDLAIVQIPAVLSFLLPQIIISCVKLLEVGECIEIGRRIALLLCNILKKDSNTFGINWKSVSDASQEMLSFELRDHYTSCQAIFNLIDGIKILVGNNSKLLKETIEGSEKELIVLSIGKFKAILDAIPDFLVAHASISCGSYARGVMIIEHKLTFDTLSFDFFNPCRSLSKIDISCSMAQSEHLDPHGIISLLCRGYCGLSDWDTLMCLSGLDLNKNPSKLSKGSIFREDHSGVSNSEDNLEERRQESICKAFALECKGQYKAACELYNSLLKESKSLKLWTCWYRIVQLAGPNTFIKFPILPRSYFSSDSLFAESITACWKLSLWDELDTILSCRNSAENIVLEISEDPSSGANQNFRFPHIITERNNELCQHPPILQNNSDNDTFWVSLLMRDSTDIWFMEKTARALSLMRKSKFPQSYQMIDAAFKHLVRPLGLAIRESKQVTLKCLEKIMVLNTLAVIARFHEKKCVSEEYEKNFASSLIKKAQMFAKNRFSTLMNILGTAKVALELGDKFVAATDISLFLSKFSRLNDFNVHIPGCTNLLSKASKCSYGKIVVESALKLYKSGNVEEAITELKKVASNDFNGFYNLVKLYSESNLLIPKVAVSYMHQVLEISPRSFKENLLYAKYLDRLLESRIKNSQNIKLVVNNVKVKSKSASCDVLGESTYTLTGIEGIPGMYSFIELVGVTICAYFQSLCFIHSAKTDTDFHVRRVMEKDPSKVTQREDPVKERGGDETVDHVDYSTMDDDMDIVDILTKVISIMCFYCTANTKQFCTGVSFEEEACELFFKCIYKKIHSYDDAFPHYYWYSVISQLVSRCQHKILGEGIFQPIIAGLVSQYPKQTLWSTLYFGHSVSAKRRKIHTNIVKLVLGLKSDITETIECYDAMFREVHKVAMDGGVSTKEQSATRFYGLWRLINEQKTTENILIPTREQLSFENINFCGSMMRNELEHVCGMSESIQVLRSKQKPKKIGFISTSGKVINFLIKNELKGDLRKDMRMMEAVTYIVRLMKTHHNGLPPQNYSVIPISEVSGIIEWVSNMCTVRLLVLEELRTINPKIEENTKADIEKYSKAVSTKNYAQSLDIYNNLLIQRPPVLHRVYLKLFKDPATWYSARKQFIFTCALWNMFGYIVGLGDRHAENILLNLKTGQAMHVDFDCLFGKGAHLQIPELVPFRLTQNIVCNMGICGVSIHGPYYSESLRFLKILHQNRKKLTAILMSFVFDPLIDWDHSTGERTFSNSNSSQRAFQCVEDKLRGIVNVILPSVEIPTSLSKQTMIGSVQAGSENYKTFETVAEPLEPRQQLQQLIQAATSPAHLSKMFVGWAPWL